MSYSSGPILPIALVGGVAFLAVVAIVLINPSALQFGAIGATYCSNVQSISPQLQYTQITGLPSDLLSILDPSANTLGVFKGQLNFIGACEQVNAFQKTDGDKKANVKSISATLTKLSCDYDLSQPIGYSQIGKTARVYYKPVTLTYSSIAFSTCNDDLVLMGKIGGATFSDSPVGEYIPDACKMYYTQSCQQNAGYKAYYSSSFTSLVGGIRIERQAICAKTTFEGTGQFYSSERSGTFKPNGAVTINYGTETLVLDTATNHTVLPTSDKKAYFKLSQTSGAFAQDCDPYAYVYYKDDISKYFITKTSMENAKSQYDALTSTVEKSLETYRGQVQAYNNELGSLTIVNVTGVNILNQGQKVSIDRMRAPNINPIVDFAVIAENISITAYLANPTFTSTNPPSGTNCLSTTSTTQTQISATLFSPTKGQVTVNAICDSPLGHRESEQNLNFANGGETLTAIFTAYVPANNYTCHFYAYNYGLGGKALATQSNSFCAQSIQTVYEDCKSLYGQDTLKQPDLNTGHCICPYTQSSGAALCGSGSTFSISDCKCSSQQPTPTPGSCLFAPTSCPASYNLVTGANGCKECVSVTCENQPISCPANYTLAKDTNGCNVCTPVQRTSCRAEVDAISCQNWDFSCQINKSTKSISCLLEEFNNFIANLVTNVALLAGLLCFGGIIIITAAVGGLTYFGAMGRRRR